MLRRAMTGLAVAKLRRSFGAPLPFDAIAGAETAGIPWACWLADQLDLPLRYVRKSALGIGRNAQVEGGPVDGRRVSAGRRPDHRWRQQGCVHPRPAGGRRNGVRRVVAYSITARFPARRSGWPRCNCGCTPW